MTRHIVRPMIIGAPNARYNKCRNRETGLALFNAALQIAPGHPDAVRVVAEY